MSDVVIDRKAAALDLVDPSPQEWARVMRDADQARQRVPFTPEADQLRQLFDANHLRIWTLHATDPESGDYRQVGSMGCSAVPEHLVVLWLVARPGRITRELQRAVWRVLKESTALFGLNSAVVYHAPLFEAMAVSRGKRVHQLAKIWAVRVRS